MIQAPAPEPFRCGTVAVIGRPNTGKSTLVNALVGSHVTITSRKPQTTRQRVRGVVTTPDAQIVLVDTPGYQTEHGGALNRLMHGEIVQSLGETDCAMLLIDATRVGEVDLHIAGAIPAGVPLIAVVNKIDRLTRDRLLPLLARLGRIERFAAIVPISAQRGSGLKGLLRVLRAHLPQQPALYAHDEITDRNERFLAAELIREKLFRLLGDELPYGVGVVVDRFRETAQLRAVRATIVVDKDSHKAMIIGTDGAKLKRIATDARLEMQRLFGAKVHLEVWVKVQRGWSADARRLKAMGYG